jgi:HSP20 family protein
MTLVKVNNPVTRTFDGLMNELFNDLPVGFGKAMREDVLNYPPVNIVEKKDHYHLQLAAPGLEKSDFNIKMDGKLLIISTEKKEEKTEETDKMIRREFSYKAFKRSFTVDEKIDVNNISAVYENGILKLDLPKKEEAKNITTEIKVK